MAVVAHRLEAREERALGGLGGFGEGLNQAHRGGLAVAARFRPNFGIAGAPGEELIGTAAGAGLGATIGGGLGSAAGTALGSGADQMTSGYEDEEANKKQQRDAMLMTLMGLRR